MMIMNVLKRCLLDEESWLYDFTYQKKKKAGCMIRDRFCSLYIFALSTIIDKYNTINK